MNDYTPNIVVPMLSYVTRNVTKYLQQLVR